MAGWRTAEDSAAGYSCQPRVEHNGTQILFDDLLGTGLAVVGFGVDPRSIVNACDPVWNPLQTRFVEVRSNRSTESDIVVDTEQVLGPWFRSHNASIAVLRPDRYVFGLYSTAHATRAATDLRTALATT